MDLQLQSYEKFLNYARKMQEKENKNTHFFLYTITNGVSCPE